jgi:hypothetical protein
VTPGKPSESELWRRINARDPEDRMMRRWIEQGAKWEGHWAFLPIQRPPAPAVTAAGFSRNAVDAFILEKLRVHGLQPSPEADRVTIMRLSFDLTGLPPTSEEVDTFRNDRGDRACENLVDRLLASPRYGERMAMWWLDLVRYADSVGYHGDQPVSVHVFRDYVIRAFNQNKRFHEFTLEQLAGDLLPSPTLEQKIASGYNRLDMMSAEGGVQPKEYLAKYIAERVRNVSGTWLGVTMGCCECHSHKYDPLTSRDFYSMEAFFADIQERGLYGGAHESGDWGPRVQLPSAEQTAERDRLDRELADARKTLDTNTPELAADQQRWEQSQPVWTPLALESFAASADTELKRLADGSLLAGGKSPDQDTYPLVAKDPPRGITAIRLDVLPDESLPKQGPGRSPGGNFVLTEVVAKGQSVDGADLSVAWKSAAATFEQTAAANASPYKKWPAQAAIDRDAKGANWGWAVLEQVGKPHFSTCTRRSRGTKASA